MDSSPNPDYRKLPVRPPQRKKRKRFLYERRVLVLSLLCATPGTIAFFAMSWVMSWSNQTRFSLLALLLFLTLILIAVLHDQIIRPLQTLTNVVSALREEDYSFRARGAAPNDALGELALEINTLADLLADQRTRTIEATALLRRVVEVIDVPLFAFDPDGLLRLVNSAGEQLLQKPASALLGRSIEQSGMAAFTSASNETQIVLPQTPNSRWLIRRSQFRQGGVPHTLIVLSDVSRALRDEERSAWQRLIRVLGHELNNSLAPIKSIAGTLSTRLNRMLMDDNERKDFTKGLEIIESRSASLNRFLQAYRRLAQMPQPTLGQVKLRDLIERVAALETRAKVVVEGGPEIAILVDSDQVEQMMINVTKNAAEASLEAAAREPGETASEIPAVSISWHVYESTVAIEVKDRGPGLLNPDNAFVPFYTTKSEGTGIGLVLSRQIAEAHGGTIQLSNRNDAHGCVARILLPTRGNGHANS
jgi:two-component system, NtrC family, nitrogen regulation sensor histidine kinase NtrY